MITFDYKERKKSSFKVQNGDSKALFEFLKSQVYDGGTAYNQLDFNSEDSEVILLFSDGLDNFGGFKEEFNRPIFAINSKTSADHKELQQVSLQSGGNYINFKNLGLGVLVILPYSPITIPYIFKKAQEYKIDIVPKWYKDITNENKEIK